LYAVLAWRVDLARAVSIPLATRDSSFTDHTTNWVGNLFYPWVTGFVSRLFVLRSKNKAPEVVAAALSGFALLSRLVRH
jgi:hypothetical protein